MRAARTEALVFQPAQDAGEAGHQKAGLMRDLGGVGWAAFLEHAQDAPLLFRDAGIGKHRADRAHHGFAGPEQGNRQRS